MGHKKWAEEVLLPKNEGGLARVFGRWRKYLDFAKKGFFPEGYFQCLPLNVRPLTSLPYRCKLIFYSEASTVLEQMSSPGAEVYISSGLEEILSFHREVSHFCSLNQSKVRAKTL